jgi:predicted nucleic acid-binding protein
MISSSSPPLERGLDTMILVYSLLQGHPASLPCEQMLRSHSGWFSSPFVLAEVKHILTRVYSVDASTATAKLLQLTAGSVVLLDLDPMTILTAMQIADSHGLDLTDAVLLQTVRQVGVTQLATEDQRLMQVCQSLGIAPLSPFDNVLRQQVAAWENAHLQPKGLQRILRRVHEWLSTLHTQAAQDFWSHTGSGTHLP